MKTKLQYQGASQPLEVITRKSVLLDTAKRNARLHIIARAAVTVASGPAGLAKNAGSLLSCFSLALVEAGKDTMKMLPAWLYAHIAEFDARQPLGSVRLPDNAANGTYNLEEHFTIPFSRMEEAIGRETCYKESRPDLKFQVDALLMPNAALNLCDHSTATVTLGALTIEVIQEYADEDGPDPIFRPGLEVITQPMTQAVSDLPVDFSVDERVSDVVVLATAIDADGATVVCPAGTVINQLGFRGSGEGQMIIGPSPSPFGALSDTQREFSGGDVCRLGRAGYQLAFTKSGQLSDSIIASNFRNLKMYITGQNRAAHTGTQIWFAIRTLTRPLPEQGRAVVVPDAVLAQRYPWALN